MRSPPLALMPASTTKAADFAAQLKAAVPGGIDIYFENVGGKVFDAVVGLLNPGSPHPALRSDLAI